MAAWLSKLSDPSSRTALGRRFEALVDEAFHVARWSGMTGLARYLASSTPSLWFDLLHWALSALLFGYLASRFLLRPEIPIFRNVERRWQRIVQTVVNYALCMTAFMLVMRIIEQLVGGVAQDRPGRLGAP